MSLILRVDVDKPYGKKSISDRIKSKLREDYYLPAYKVLGYLIATEKFIVFCNDNKIKGTFYFRNSTIPDKKIIKLLKEGGHEVGFHAENTLNITTFKNEILKFKNKLPEFEIKSFTKHGSGKYKLGRNHYPPYEPLRYQKWAKDLGLKYIFGNEICKSKIDFDTIDGFFSKMFWIHRDYRDFNFSKLEDLIEEVKNKNIPIIIHPSNFFANKNVNQDFKRLVSLTKKNNISWDLPNY
ncbi:MAG: hypothetical protein QM486_01165 [Flavobacteriaceae bacterium]